MLSTLRRVAAFTLVEVLVVVAILGVLGGIVVPSLLTAGELGVQAAARSVVADLLVAQNEAVAAQAERTVHFDTTNSRYGVFDENNQIVTAAYLPVVEISLDFDNNDVTGPAARGKNFITDFRTGDTYRGVQIISADFGGIPRVTFDALGSPINGGTVQLMFDSQVMTVEVAPFTGRLTVTDQQ